MELREGYKQTEVGVIPEDWDVFQLKAVTLDMLQGVNTAIDIPEYVDSSGIPMLKANNVIDKEVMFEGADHISLKTYARYSDRYKLKKNDFLFSNIGARLGTGSLLRSNIDCSFAWNVMRIIPNPREIVPQYLSSIINSPKISQNIKDNQSGSGMGFVPKGTMAKVSIPLPPTKAEQTVIANALSDTDAWIQSLTRLIAKKRQIKQGAMQTLLNPYEHGCLKAGWVVKKLGDAGVFSKGTGVKKDEASSGTLPCIRYGEIYTRHTEYIKCFHSFISQDVAATAKRIKTGDLLFAGSGETKEEIGKCIAFLDDFEAYAGGDIVIFSPTHISSNFLGFYLNTEIVNQQKASKGQGDAVVHISATALGSIDFPSLLAGRKTSLPTYPQ